MEIGREEIEDMSSLSPPTLGSMQIAGSNGFAHNIEFMSQAYLRNRYSEINIMDESSNIDIDRPLPVLLKVGIWFCFQELFCVFEKYTLPNRF